MLGEIARRSVFWMLDASRGGQIKAELEEIRRRNQNEEVNTPQLKRLLAHAVSTTDYYKNYDPSDLNSFPVLSKNQLREHWDEICSDAFKGQSLYTTSTSGSTGIPLKMIWNPQKRSHQLADVVYMNELLGQKVGQRYLFLRENIKRYKKSWVERTKQNLEIIDITYLDDAVLESICRRLRRLPQINYCIAYASVYEALIKYMRKCGGDPDSYRINSFLTSSEVFSLEQKRELSELTNAKVYDRYSNEENGLIAQTDHLSDVFRVNVASFMVEILKQDSDEPAEPGEIGRIVITDLYNLAVPLIRYDTGDLSIAASAKDGWVTGLKTIQGRQSDVIYDTKGRKMTTSVWNVYMGNFDQIRQYQFIQEGARDYCLKVNVESGLYRDSELINAIKKAVGQDANVVIEHVDGIPALSSGKFKKTVCNYQYDPRNYEA